MSDKFYNWLARKYGWGELTFSTLDEDFQETLVREYCSIKEGGPMEITLKAARVNAGLTQEQVVAETGISRSTLHRWENGKGSPKFLDLQRLCELYGIAIGCIKK